jgi:hypothetical protein
LAENLNFDVAEFDPLPGVLQSDGARYELRVMIIQDDLAVVLHQEMFALGSQIEVVPLAHGNDRLIVALEMAGEAAGVIAVVVVRLTVVRLIVGGWVADLQLVADLVGIAFFAAAARR